MRFDLQLFDVVIIHYSVRLAFPGYLSPAFRAALRTYRGLKLLFIQDDYDYPDVVTEAINELGINVVFTVIPPAYQGVVYPRVKCETEFISVLTGYVSPELETPRLLPRPAQRKTVIGYRSRDLPYRYGRMTREKFVIGVRMKEICAARQIPHDIEYSDGQRLYGDSWYSFLAQSRATLGSETGSNVLDPDGCLSAEINQALVADRSLTFEDIFDRFLVTREGQIVTNQVSPRIFEAIALRTGLILFDGSYSNVVHPHVHFIPLRKDFSNVDEVLDQVQDCDYLEAMTDRAYCDVIRSGRYRYSRMIEFVDEVIARKCGAGPHAPRREQLASAACLTAPSEANANFGLFALPLDARRHFPCAESGIKQALRWVWRRCPLPLQKTARFLARTASRESWHSACRIGLLLLRQAPARGMLHTWLLTRAMRNAIPLSALAKDLWQLRCLAAQLCGTSDGGFGFALELHCDADLARLEFVSVVSLTGARQDPADHVQRRVSFANGSWEHVQAAVREVGRLEILWDHSTVGPVGELVVPAPNGQCTRRPAYRYRFEALTAVSRRDCAAVIRLLQATFAASGPVAWSAEASNRKSA